MMNINVCYKNFITYVYNKREIVMENIGKIKETVHRLRSLDQDKEVLPEELRVFTTPWKSTFKEDKT